MMAKLFFLILHPNLMLKMYVGHNKTIYITTYIKLKQWYLGAIFKPPFWPLQVICMMFHIVYLFVFSTLKIGQNYMLDYKKQFLSKYYNFKPLYLAAIFNPPFLPFKSCFHRVQHIFFLDSAIPNLVKNVFWTK